MNDIEIIENTNLLVYKKGYTADFVNETIIKMKLDGLSIFDHIDRLDNIDFLKDCTNLKKLYVYCLDDQDYSFLANMTLLTHLSIGQSIKPKNTIHFSNLINLEELTIDWRKNKIKGLENCKKLKNLCIWSFKEDNFIAIKELAELKTLDIRTASIKTTDGLQNLRLLENLSLGYCRNLTSLKNINGLQNLKTIVVENCSKIEDYDDLNKIDNLKTLELIDVKGIKSIKFIENFKLLKKLVLTGSTDILDGDLKPATFVKEVIYNPRKHYNIIIENKRVDEITKRNPYGTDMSHNG